MSRTNEKQIHETLIDFLGQGIATVGYIVIVVAMAAFIPVLLIGGFLVWIGEGKK